MGYEIVDPPDQVRRRRVQLPMAIQFPAALCDTMEELPSMVLMEHWTFK